MKEAIKLALDLLRPISHNTTDDPRGQADKVIKALEEALSKQEQGVPVGVGGYLTTTTPQQRTWVGLTDDEIEQGIKESWVTEQAFQSAVWWAEAKLKEKNT
jgi:hypothetical protein